MRLLLILTADLALVPRAVRTAHPEAFSGKA